MVSEAVSFVWEVSLESDAGYEARLKSEAVEMVARVVMLTEKGEAEHLIYHKVVLRYREGCRRAICASRKALAPSRLIVVVNMPTQGLL